MSLIQTLVTQNDVIQVSDRRLTTGGKIYDDSYNRAASCAGCMSVGSTGYAYIDYDENQSRQPPPWLAEPN
jgi:hypothetical protein